MYSTFKAIWRECCPSTLCIAGEGLIASHGQHSHDSEGDAHAYMRHLRKLNFVQRDSVTSRGAKKDDRALGLGTVRVLKIFPWC
jgi:hypothetical protein